MLVADSSCVGADFTLSPPSPQTPEKELRQRVRARPGQGQAPAEGGPGSSLRSPWNSQATFDTEPIGRSIMYRAAR